MVQKFRLDDQWADVKQQARVTVGMDGSGKYPESSWKRQILLAQHSPIRIIKARWKWVNLKSWISVHFVRHKFGIQHWVRTQRSDRTGVDRDKLPQDSLVQHACQANAQAMIFISRRRLCRQAHPETRKAWMQVVDNVKAVDPQLGSVMVPQCIYRGFCPQFKTCGYAGTKQYQERLKAYRDTHHQLSR